MADLAEMTVPDYLDFIEEVEGMLDEEVEEPQAAWIKRPLIKVAFFIGGIPHQVVLYG